ncbi:hypothetical protein Q9966_008646 [Columba livia]|nr:hypothetical protein Q9966_008646 [Columba livia]
MTRIHLQRS